MTVQQIANMAPNAAADEVQTFYEAHPYPPPVEALAQQLFPPGHQ
jgi:hypothetical protein